MEKNMKICLKCGELYVKGKGALSRRDNKTEICPTCGTREALEDFKKYCEKEKCFNGNKII
jgi:hypothetical protein